MRKRFLAALLLASCGGPALRKAAPGDVLEVVGKVDRAPLGFSAAEVGALAKRTVRGSEPGLGREAAYAGVDLAPLLTEGLPLQRGVDTAIFHGKGGYRAAVPLNAIRQSRPVLATEMDAAPLERAAPGAGPAMLAWPVAESPGLETDPRHRWWWVRGVTRIELAAWQPGYGRALRVPAGAPDDARHGADLFASQCLHCHRIRGQGGEAGPELTKSEVASDARQLAAVLVAHGGGAPARAVALPPGGASQVAQFLRAVQVASGGPEEAPEPEPLPSLPPPRAQPGRP
jgi:mono/diheme cytochrome c family protein